MLRTLGMSFAALLMALVVAPQARAEADVAPSAMHGDASAFGEQSALSDTALADVYGTGPEPRAFVKRVARDGFEDFSRQTTTLLPVTFDNWFVDNAALIINNVVR